MSTSNINDRSTLQVHCICFGGVEVFLSLSQRTSGCRDRLSIRHFVLAKQVSGKSFLTQYNSAQRLTAVSGLAWCRLRWCRKCAAWCCPRSEETDSIIVRMQNDGNHKYRLGAVAGTYLRLFCESDFCKDRLPPFFRFSCIDFLFSSAWLLGRGSFSAENHDFELPMRERTSSAKIYTL